MSYTVLARKYRSQGFDDIVGQEPISQTLKNAIKTGRIAHAFLFSGTRGVGKTTMARVLAKALNCLSADGPTVKPCCKCELCKAVNAGEDIDVIEIDGASNNSVDEVRRLRENAVYRPARARFKIYIIDEVHMLSTGAFNALLKILEEPPSHVKFIFATTEPNKVIPTIQSRCQRFDFSNIDPLKIAGQLKFVLEAEKIKFEEDLVLQLARMANGSMRDGLSLLDRLLSIGQYPLSVSMLEEFLGCPNSEMVYNLIQKIGDSDAAGTLLAAEQLVHSGLDEVQITDSLIDSMRDIMLLKSAGIDTKLLILTASQKQRIELLTAKFDIAALVYNITTLEKLRWTLKNSETARALLDACLLRFALSEHFINVDFLLSQVKGTSAFVKKNVTSKVKASFSSPEQSELVKSVPIQIIELDGTDSVKSNWQNIMTIITNSLGSSTAALLSAAEPISFDGNLLTVAFPSSGQMQKKMCESNGRLHQIESLLTSHSRKNIKLKFEIIESTQVRENAPVVSEAVVVDSKSDLMNNPAVKTVLMGLDATVTNIEEN